MFKRIILLSATIMSILLLAFNTNSVTAQSYCDWASYVADVTVPDGTVLPPGTSFKKIWKIKNIGTCTWGTQYKFSFISGSQMGAPSEVSLSQAVAPGESVNIIVNMVAPSSNGTYYNYWRLKNASGSQFGIGSQATGVIWTKLIVSQGGATSVPTATSSSAYTSTPTTGSTTATATNVCNWAKFVADVTIPDSTELLPSQSFTKVWRFKNIGTCDWSSGYKIVFISGTQMGAASEIALPSKVAVGESVDISVNLTSPSSTGTYYGFWRFKDTSGNTFGIGSNANGVFWLKIKVTQSGSSTGIPYYTATPTVDSAVDTDTPEPVYTATTEMTSTEVPSTVEATATPTVKVTATSASKTATPTDTYTPEPTSAATSSVYPTVAPGDTCDLVGSVTDVTIPDNTIMQGQQSFVKTWRIKNAGSCTWSSSYKFVFVTGMQMSSTTVVSLSKTVSPGNTVDISVNMTAPSVLGIYTSYWKMKNASGQVFGSGTGTMPMWVKINVNSLAAPTATPTATLSAKVCNWASVVKDITVPDGTVFYGGDKFVKTWRLKNIGTCTWTTGYKLIYDSGNQMNGPSEVSLPKSVAPGATVDITVNLQAPNYPSNYIGYWKLKSASGEKFGIGKSAISVFWVKIQSVQSIKVSYDFIAQECNATWQTNYGTISCPSKDNYVHGSVNDINNPTLEGGSNRKDQNTIITIPPDGKGGYIKGIFPAFQIHKGDNLITKMGCLDDAPKCDVLMELSYLDVEGVSHSLVKEHGQTRDGYITDVNMLLDDLDGVVVQFVFTVKNNTGSSTDDHAFWFVPTIWRR
jgi:hypothetical protein